MTVKFFYLPSSKSCRQMRAFLEESGIEFEPRYLMRGEMSFEEFKDILSKTQDGVDEIISDRSKPYKKLVSEGVDFDELTLKEIYELTLEYPKLFRSPIVLTEDYITVGYNLDEVGLHVPKKTRRAELQKALTYFSANGYNDIIRDNEESLNEELEEENDRKEECA